MAKYTVEELSVLLEDASAVTINGEFYNVHYVYAEENEADEYTNVVVYYIDDMCIYDYNFTLEELTEKDVVVYENKEVTIKDNKVVEVV